MLLKDYSDEERVYIYGLKRVLALERALGRKGVELNTLQDYGLLIDSHARRKNAKTGKFLNELLTKRYFDNRVLNIISDLFQLKKGDEIASWELPENDLDRSGGKYEVV